MSAHPPMDPRQDLAAAETKRQLESLRAGLRDQRGAQYWRSLEELASTEQFRELLAREFALPLPDGSGLSRRRFLQLMGASLALAGLSGCTIQPDERIVPYVQQPEQLIPGKPLYYATVTGRHGGLAQGLLVESHMGRPTKIEGNPEHPTSLGASDRFAQASILDLYDPARSQTPLYLGRIRTWRSFEQELAPILAAQEALGGAGIRILSGATSSPTFARLLAALRRRFPQLKWLHWDAVCRDAERAASLAAFGEIVELQHDFSRADVVVSFDADFLTSGPWHLTQARSFAARRRTHENGGEMSRFYAFESLPTGSGSLADHRFAVTPAQLAAIARALAHELGVPGAMPAALPAPLATTVAAIAEDLRAHRSRCLLVAGMHTPTALQTLVHALNEQLGNVGSTVRHGDAVELEPASQVEGLQTLVRDLNDGRVDLLLMLGGNPVFDAPADLDFAAAMAKAKLRVHLSSGVDESSRYCQWHLPQSHELESWGDLRAADGTASIQQPLLRPLYQSRSAIEVLAWLDGEAGDPLDLVRQSWSARADFEAQWQRWLHDGVIAGSAASVRNRPLVAAAAENADRALTMSSAEGLELVLRPDPTLYDGSYANNGWLQECPKPLSTLTWDNAALLSPATAERLGVATGDELELQTGSTRVRIAAFVLPGQADECIGLHFGAGRQHAGPVGDGCGIDVYPLRQSDALWQRDGVRVSRTGKRIALAATQTHHNMEGRDIVRVGTLEEYRQDPATVGVHHAPHVDADATLMPGFPYDGYKWGLAVDLGACTGCNACVVACQAENNVPIVGKDEVLNGREMQWIRIDRYYAGEPENPLTLHQPVMCMHCEQAPCEVVCPVAATVHSDEGLNDMVYNRCVGTRYCSNNCPYKVRRFNYYQYADKKSETLAMQRNPDVTVRNRGVMEKCTYCVQRINQARIEAKVSDLPLGDGAVVTACQQACPSQAIVFGDLNDPNARVTRWKESGLDYGLLADLGTRPRTSYLARVRNPNPALESDSHGEEAAHDAH